MKHHNVGTLIDYDGTSLIYKTPAPPDYLVAKQGFDRADVIFWDGRRRTPEQNDKVHAIIADIAFSTGYLPAEAKMWLKYEFTEQTGADDFSMSDCSVTQARLFINFLIDFAFEWDIPLTDNDFSRTADIDAYLYSCLMRKKCCVCFERAQCHHWPPIAMGHNRNKIIHIGRGVMALCGKHHKQAHKIGQKDFEAKYHVYAITADENICEVYKLNTRER